MDLAGPFCFTKGSKVLRLQAEPFQRVNPFQFGTLLYDLKADPQQTTPITDRETEARMIALMVRLMRENDAPTEQFERLGLSSAGLG